MTQPAEHSPQEHEKTLARENLKKALEELSPELINMGVYRVTGEVGAFAKDLAKEGVLEINLDPEINDIALIKLTFSYQGKADREIFINGWRDDKNHLSGPATKEIFVSRIRRELGMDASEDEGGGNTVMDELQALADSFQKEDDVLPPEYITDVKVFLLDSAEKFRGTKMNDRRIEVVLEMMASVYPLKGAKIVRHEVKIAYSHPEKMVTGMYEFGNSKNGDSYQVWLEREDYNWVIAYAKTPPPSEQYLGNTLRT